MTRDPNTIQQEVLQCTGLTQEEYAIHQWEQAFAFLHHHIGEEDEYVVSQYTLTREFWAWWRMQWSFRDEVFLDTIKSHRYNRTAAIQRVWLQWHNPERIDAYPPTHLVRKAMAEMDAQVKAQLKRKMEEA